ncbi:MAG: hypothetical protein MI975_02575, partial [Cytophagales bacterium]|nr:hypothetical protein [Cytophagales bacterium]
MKSFDTSLLYVLSGTGNTYRVACWIKAFFNSNQIEVCLKFIADADFQSDFHDSDRRLITILFLKGILTREGMDKDEFLITPASDGTISTDIFASFDSLISAKFDTNFYNAQLLVEQEFGTAQQRVALGAEISQ